jgi:hypothetical protein
MVDRKRWIQKVLNIYYYRDLPWLKYLNGVGGGGNFLVDRDLSCLPTSLQNSP